MPHPHPANNHTVPPYTIVAQQASSAEPVLYRVLRTRDHRVAGYQHYGQMLPRQWPLAESAWAFISKIAEDGEHFHNPIHDADDHIEWITA